MTENEVHSYRENPVWKKSMSLAKDVYKITSAFPEAERGLLGRQMREAAVAIPSQLAMGFEAGAAKDRTRFFDLARNSAFLLGTHIDMCAMFDMTPDSNCVMLCAALDEIKKALTMLIRSAEPHMSAPQK